MSMWNSLTILLLIIIFCSICALAIIIVHNKVQQNDLVNTSPIFFYLYTRVVIPKFVCKVSMKSQLSVINSAYRQLILVEFMQLSSYVSCSRSKHSLLIGRIKMLDFVLIVALRTKPLFPMLIFSTLPIGHEFRGAELSITSTMSPTARFLSG